MATKGLGLPFWRRIRPAGWVAILTVLGVGGYLGWKVGVPALSQRSTPTPSPSPTVEATPSPSPSASSRPVPSTTPTSKPTPAEPPGATADVLSPSLFPDTLSSLPPPASTLPPVGVPPLRGSHFGEVAFQKFGSESDVIKAVAEEKLAAGIVSVAALAGRPESIKNGVRAVWFLGEWPSEGHITSCDAEQLRKSQIGVVISSLSHYELARVLAGAPMPEMMLAGDLDTLTEAWTKHEVTQGEPPLASTEAHPSCFKDAGFSTSFVIVHNEKKPLSPTELSGLVSRVKDVPSEARVRAFLTEDESSAFGQVFSSAGKVWKSLHLIDKPTKVRDAIDLRFAGGEALTTPAETTKLVEIPVPEQPKAAGPKYGYPSSIFDF